MALLIEFASTHFDVEAEAPNPFNPIRGRALGAWASGALRERGFETTAVEPEDWGWAVDVVHEGRRYLLGFVAYDADPSGDVPYLVQVHKRRSLLEKLKKRAVLVESDPLVTELIALLRGAGIASEIEATIEP